MEQGQKPTIYIAGPMTGLPEYNYPAFRSAMVHLAAKGWDTKSPTEHGLSELTGPYEMYFKLGLKVMLECDSIALLPGWTASTGARREVMIALACGMSIFSYLEGREKDPLMELKMEDISHLLQEWPMPI